MTRKEGQLTQPLVESGKRGRGIVREAFWGRKLSDPLLNLLDWLFLQGLK